MVHIYYQLNELTSFSRVTHTHTHAQACCARTRESGDIFSPLKLPHTSIPTRCEGYGYRCVPQCVLTDVSTQVVFAEREHSTLMPTHTHTQTTGSWWILSWTSEVRYAYWTQSNLHSYRHKTRDVHVHQLVDEMIMLLASRHWKY